MLNLRQTMIASAISIANEDGTPITIEGLAPLLPTDFCLEQIDIDEQPPAGVTGSLDAGEQIDALTGEPVEDAAPVVKLPATEPIQGKPAAVVDPEVASGSKQVQAEDALSNARARVLAAQDHEHRMNAALATAVVTFQRGLAPVTHEALARQHIASEVEQRRLVASGVIRPREVATGNSQIDRAKMWARGGSVDAGRGNSGRCYDMVGGMPVYGAHMKGRKVPSER